MMKLPFKNKLTVYKVFFLLIIVIVAAFIAFGRTNHSSLSYPAYLNYNSKFVFSVPTSYTVDSRTIAGIEIVRSGNLTAKTYDDIYNAGNVTLEPITSLKDQSSGAFKDYINNNFIPSLKKKYSSGVIKTKFIKVDGWDVAKVTVTQSGKPQRFIYLKNGKHPVAIVSKTENAAIKTIDQSVMDVETSPLKDEITPLKQAFADNIKLIIEKNSVELYKQAAPVLRSSTTEDQLSKILQDISTNYTASGISVYDGIYNASTKEFNAIMNYLPAKSGDPSVPIALYLIKINDQWKLKGISIITGSAQ